MHEGAPLQAGAETVAYSVGGKAICVRPLLSS